MSHINSQAATKAQSLAVPSETSLDLEDSSDSSKEGTRSDKSASDSVSTMSPNSFMAEEKPELGGIEAEEEDSASVGLEDTSCGVEQKKVDKSRKENIVIRDNRSDSRTIKGGASADRAVSCVVAEQEEGCATFNLATTMERVNPELCAFGRSSSPYVSSDNDWEASDTDADHSDSSDDDNPTSQVDRMIECGTRLIMDGENSNLTSETDDTDDDDDDFDSDSDSDITDVSPLVSNTGSPLGLSPVMSRRNLPSLLSSKPPFMRHYSHRGHDGDVEDEEEEEHDFTQWTDDLYNGDHDNTNIDADSANMSLVVQALLKIGLETRKNNGKDNNSESMDSVNQNDMSLPRVAPSRHSNMSPALQANPHHRHLRKTSHSRRKNMSFTNEEVRIINRDNSIMLEKLLAVSGRPEKAHSNNSSYRQSTVGSKPASSSINRRRQDDEIQKENLAILRRLQEVKPSRAVTASRTNSSTHTSGRHHHYHHHTSNNHHHHKSHTEPATTAPATATAATAQSCSVTARQSGFSPPHHHHHHHHHHHSPKETAL